MIVDNIAAHKIKISIKASKGLLSPKNKIDHKELSANWIENKESANFDFLLYSFQTR